ncbi:MAG: hypothetical protein FWH10_09330 [Oscillospiraceae bacterium]|nr:hypothetical protein [Oscillospiraceae bacterium]
MKKVLFVLFTCCFIVTALVSCGPAEDNPGNNSQNSQNDRSGGSVLSEENNGGEEENTRSAFEEKLPPPELPEINLNGEDFVIASNDYSIPIWVQRDIGAEEQTGDNINDAVYLRNSRVEEKFNCVIVDNQVDGVSELIRRLVRAGDNSLDAATIRLRNMGDLITGNNLVEFGNLVHIDLDKPWWDINSANDLSVANKIFAVASDITLMDKDSTSAMVFNKKLQADYGIESLYSLVKEGGWTLDKLTELSKIASVDVDGNGIMDDNDAYGLLYQRDTFSSFLSGSGEFVAKKDNNDLPVMTLNTPKALEVLDKLYDFLYDEQYCFHVMKFWEPKNIDWTDGMTGIFQDNRALFMWIRMADVENLRNMDADFGILPIPKYDVGQLNYLQTVNPYVGVATAVPQSAKSAENSSAILEYMAYESRYILQSAYYEIVLETKIARDEESAEMLDIIFNNRVYDIGDVYDFGGIGYDLIFMTMTFNRNIVSTYERRESSALRAIDRLVERVLEIETE